MQMTISEQEYGGMEIPEDRRLVSVNHFFDVILRYIHCKMGNSPKFISLSASAYDISFFLFTRLLPVHSVSFNFPPI